MEKLKVVGNAFLVLVTETALIGASLLVLGSIAAAASGCSQNKSGSGGEAVEVNDCLEASAWEVAEALGEGYGVKLVGGYYFFTLGGKTENPDNGLSSFHICLRGKITSGRNGNNLIRSAYGRITWGDRYGDGVSEVAAEEMEVLALLGEGYSIQDGREYPVFGIECTDCATRHIHYGGQQLTGGHESFFQKAGAVYGRIYDREQLVRDTDEKFITGNGRAGILATHEKNAAPVLNFLGNEWSVWTNKDKVQLLFMNAPATKEYDSFYMKGDRIFGVNGEVDFEVLMNRPNLESLALPPKVEEDCPCGAPESKDAPIADGASIFGTGSRTDESSFIGKPCTTNDNELGKLEDDFDATKYKLGHGYKCVPFRRGL